MGQMILTLDAYVALLVVLINFVFLILIIVRTSRTIIYIIFLFICIANMFWNFGDFMVFFTQDRFWFYLSLIGSGMLPSLMFHWVNTIVRPERKSTFWIVPAYFSSGFLAFSSPLAILSPKVQWFVDSKVWNVLFLVLLGPFLLVSIIMLFRAISRANSAEEKNRLRYVLIAAITGVSTGLTDLVQVFRIPVPPLGHLGCLVYSSILAIGVFKHRIAYDILAEMRTKLEGLSEMAIAIAHEIRNPLSSIKGASNLMAHELRNLNHPKCKEYHGMITEEIERLNNILNNFQYFTRPLKIEKDSLSINEVIQKTIKLAEVSILNLRIGDQLSKELPMVQADASLMKQVFLNLIKNSAEACHSGGELVIRTEAISHWVKISFLDDGPGIPTDLLNHIFEPFFTTKTTGMGVGLAISRSIIEAHNGRIEVNNILPRGTEFSIFLPI